MSALQEIAIDLEADRAASVPEPADRQGGPIAALKAWLDHLPIGRKISLFFGANLGFALIAGLMVVVAFIEIGQRSAQTSEASQSAFIAEKVLLGLSQAQSHRETFFSLDDAVKGNAALDEFDRVLLSLDQLGALAGSSSNNYTSQITNITGAVVEHCRELNLALTAQLEGRSPATEKVSDGQVNTTIAQARQLAQQLERDATSSSAASQSLIATILAIWIALSGVLILLTLIAQRYFDRHVGAALSHLAGQMSQLSAGQKIADVEASNRTDEIGEMTRAMMIFHRAGMQLEALSLERSKKAQEKLKEQTLLREQQEESRLERERTLGRIADNFERRVRDVVGQVANASSQLQSTATNMAASAEQASTRTSEVTGFMREANAGATAAAAASDEFAMSIEEVSRQAASSAQLARRASTSTKEADETISDLAQSAEQVGHIVELIQTIAQRTNLLALNASIEAARGGEAGRGFAVVASEVKELAMQTSRATEEVAQQIRAMQDTTGASVSALQSISKEVTELESVAVSIASAVGQQSHAGQDLARSIDMAARGTEQVSGNIQEVQELSTSTGAAAAQVLSSATSLDQQATTLRTQVNAFLEEVRSA